MKQIAIILSFLLPFYLFSQTKTTDVIAFGNTSSEKSHELQPVVLKANGRYLQWSDGRPFFAMACTAWTLPCDYEKDEVLVYLDNRVAAGYTVIQMSAVFSEIVKTRYQAAFDHSDLLQPNAVYWENVDWVIKQATDRGLVVMINPIWKRSVNDFIKAQGVEKCFAYGKWFANRYKDNPNVVYFIGGDEVPEPVREEMDAMGRGIQYVYNGKAVLAYHSAGDQSSKEAFPNADWITLNWTYAYSPAYFKKYPYSINYENYKKYPSLPVQFAEGFYDFGKAKKYEKNGVSARWGNRYILRRQAWWNITSGATGVAYGAEGIWYKNRDGELWQQCLQYESSKDMSRLKKIIDRLEWWKLVPDIDHQFLIEGYGEYMKDDYVTASVAEDGSFAVIYLPVQHNLTLKIPENKSNIWKSMAWFDPSSGVFFPVNNKQYISPNVVKISMSEENESGESDWVLIIGEFQ